MNSYTCLIQIKDVGSGSGMLVHRQKINTYAPHAYVNEYRCGNAGNPLNEYRPREGQTDLGSIEMSENSDFFLVSAYHVLSTADKVTVVFSTVNGLVSSEVQYDRTKPNQFFKDQPHDIAAVPVRISEESWKLLTDCFMYESLKTLTQYPMTKVVSNAQLSDTISFDGYKLRGIINAESRLPVHYKGVIGLIDDANYYSIGLAGAGNSGSGVFIECQVTCGSTEKKVKFPVGIHIRGDSDKYATNVEVSLTRTPSCCGAMLECFGLGYTVTVRQGEINVKAGINVITSWKHLKNLLHVDDHVLDILIPNII